MSHAALEPEDLRSDLQDPITACDQILMSFSQLPEYQLHHANAGCFCSQ